MSADQRTPFERAVADSTCSHGWNWRIGGTCPYCGAANISARMDSAVTPIASRQPELCPKPHHVSPAIIEYRLQQVTKERDELVACLLESNFNIGGEWRDQRDALLAKLDGK